MYLMQKQERIAKCACRKGVGISILALLVLVMPALGNQSTQTRPRDEDIALAVQTELLVADSVSSRQVGVTVNDGIVTLSGMVSHLLEKDRALEMAKTVKGVRGLIDRLVVEAVDRPDGEIAADIRAALLLDPATDSYEIDVAVNDAVVTLTGSVESWAERQLSAEVAKGVKGVKDIRNQIVYEYAEERPDGEIQTDVKGRLEMDPYVDDELITVEVEDGTVTLSGTVGSLIEKQNAAALAHVAGVRRVNDEYLQVSRWAQGDMERESRYVAVTDAEAQDALRTALAYDPRVSSYQVGVEVSNGKAVLTGIVGNLKAKRAAGEDAQNITGIWRVENRIAVRPADQYSDAAIGQNVREALARDPVVERHDIDAGVRNRRVFLTGTVDYLFEKVRAEDVASRVKGVADVENGLSVEQIWTRADDAEIKEDIESEYFWSPFVDGSDIMINVEKGHVELTGRVDTWHEYREAVENAFEGGAKSVRSYLFVEANEEYYDRSWQDAPEEVWPL